MGGRGSSGDRNSAQQNHLNIDRYEDKLKYLQSLGYSKFQSRNMLETIQHWTGFGYEKVRSGDSEMEIELEDFISRSPQWRGGNLYRAVSNSYVRDLKIGDTLPKGLTSFSSTEEVALDRPPTNMKDRPNAILVLPNTNGLKGTSIRTFSNMSYEDEVLTSRKNTFEVTSIESRNKRTYIYLKVRTT